MTTDTVLPASGVNEAGWANPNNITTSNDSCAQSNGGGTDQMYGVLAAGSIEADVSITAFHVRIESADSFQDWTSTRFYVSDDGGSAYCAGHDFSGTATANCEDGTFTTWIECTHTANYPDTKTLWETASNNRIRLETVGGGGSSTLRVDNLEARITYDILTVPPAQDLVSASSAIEDSMIQVTRNGTYPVADPTVDSWEVWRSTTSGGSYSELAAGLTATTYDDWSVQDDDQWYYKAKFTNSIGDGPLSTNPVNATTVTPEVQQSFGENIPADSEYDYNTTNEADDQVGTIDFNDTGTSITYSNSGGVFSEGYVDLPGSDGYLQASPSGLTTEDWWIATWLNPDAYTDNVVIFSIQTSTASHYVILYMDGTSGGLDLWINKSGTGSRNHDWTSTVSTGSYQLVTLAYEHSTTTVTLSIGSTIETYQHDLGALNFGNGYIRMGGGASPRYNGQYSNTFIWENELPTQDRIDQLIADGDLESAAAPQDGFDSDTRIRKTYDVGIINKNLIAHYELESDATDSQGNYDGTNNGVTFTTGKIGNAGFFERTNSDYIATPLDMSDHDPFSISAWFNTNNDGNIQQAVFGQDISGDRVCMVAMNLAASSGSQLFGFQGTTAFYSSVDPSVDTWHHVVLTIDASNSYLYLDGVQTASGSGATFASSAIVLDIGRRAWGSGDSYFDGYIDDVRIYDRILSSGEIGILSNPGFVSDTAIYKEGIGTSPPLVDSANLEGYYSLDYNADDYSGNDYHGINNGATFLTTGKVNQSADFSSDYITLPSGMDKLSNMATWTFSAWLKTPGTAGTNTVYSCGDPTLQADLFIIYIKEGTYEMRIWNNGSSILSYGSSGDFPNDIFTHVALTYDGTDVRYYRNGILQDTSSVSISSTTATQIRLGNWNTQYYDGVMDEVRIYSVVLSQQNIYEIGASSIISDTRIFVPDNEITYTDLMETRIKNTFKVLLPQAPITATPVSQWDFDTTNTYFDQVASNDLSTSNGTVTYSDTGGWNSEGYVSFDGSTPDSRIQTTSATYGGSENGSMLIVYFVWNAIWNTGSEWYGGIGTAGDDDYVRSLAPGSAPTANHRISFRTDGYFQATNTNFSCTKPTSSWMIHCYGYDRVTGEAFMWIDETKYSANAPGTWGWNNANGYITLGGISGAANNDTHRISHARIYKDFEPALADIQYFKTNGEFQEIPLIPHPSDTRIKVIDNLIEPLSDTAIFQPGWDTIEPTSATRIKVLDNEITSTIDSRILITREISRVSNTALSQAGLEITKDMWTAIFREDFGLIDITSDARIRDTFEETIISDSRIKNTYEQSSTSDSAIFRSQYGDIEVSSDARIVLEGTSVLPPIYSDTTIKIIEDITKLSDTFIVLGQEITKLSDTTIFNSQYGDITKTSDTRILVDQFGDITKLSDAAIFKSGLLIDKLSDTRIFRPGGYMYPFQRQQKMSDTRILVLGQEITKKSLTRIKDDSNEITKLSDTLIKIYPIINKTSDTRVIYPDNALLIPSSTRIKNTLELNPLSDTAIFRSQYGDITKLSDTLILREPIIDKTSDTRIVKLFEFSGISSDTYIINIGTQIDITSDTAIFRAGYGHIIKESKTAIKTDTPLEMTKLSDSRIKKTVTLNKVSDTALRRDLPPMVAIFEKSRQL